MISELGDISPERLTVETEICVIGGGLAGLLAADKLAAAGRRVVVVESGGYKADQTFDGLNDTEQSEPSYQMASTGRARRLGGTSTAWGGRMLPLTAHDMGARDYIGLEAWPIAKSDLDQFVPEIETIFGLDSSSYEELPRKLAYPTVSRLETQDLVPRWAKWPPFRRRNVANLLRHRIRTAARLHIWLGATVCDLVLDREAGRLSRITAKHPSGSILNVKADQFIIAAGTLETTRLLLLLDRNSEKRAFSSTDALGSYFSDHMAVEVGRLVAIDPHRVNRMFGYRIAGSTRRSLHLETTAAAQKRDRAASGYVIIRPEYQDGSLHHFIRQFGRSKQNGESRKSSTPSGFIGDLASVAPAAYWKARHGQMYLSRRVDLFVDIRVEQMPNLQSRLSLSQSRKDLFGVPLLNIAWHKTAADDQTFRSVIHRMGQFWRRSDLDKICPVTWAIAPDEPDLQLASRARDTRHPAGSARMGINPATSVVDPHLRCHAVPNLFIASAAAFPSTGSANPSLTIMQLALRAAEAAMSATA